MRLKAVGTIMLDCPISGTGAQAVNKDLSVYGSEKPEDAFNKCQPVFQGFANYAFYVGEFGNGSKMKFVANHLVHVHNVASAEAMVLGMKAGLDPQTIFDVIKVGAGNSRIFELRAPMMVRDDYSKATMKMEVWLKDMTTIGEFASELCTAIHSRARCISVRARQGHAQLRYCFRVSGAGGIYCYMNGIRTRKMIETPRDRLTYSPITDRPSLHSPGGARMAVGLL